MCVAIHMCMETMLGISLHSYLYLKLAKRCVFLIISFVFSLTKLENKRAEHVLPESSGGLCRRGVKGRRRERCPKQCVHM
jgi:hypothetical protein